MFCQSRAPQSSRAPWKTIAAGALLAFVSSGVALAQATTTVQPATETYRPGSFNYPYVGGGGYYGGGGGWGWGMGGWGGVGSTAAGGYLAGLGQAIRAQGQYNLDTSAAAINMTEADRRAIENQKLWTETYFEKRRINQAYRDSQRRPRGDAETWVRLAQVRSPGRLSPSELDPVTGHINWPDGLMNDAYTRDRQEVERLFADRALAHGAIGPQMHQQITLAINSMLATLKSYIKDYSTNQYVASRNFLNSLAFEASSPSGGYASTAEIRQPTPPQAR